MKQSIKTKILLLSIVPVVITAVVLAGIVFASRDPMVNKVANDFKELGRSETSKIAKMVYDRCESSYGERDKLVHVAMHVATDKLEMAGAVTFDQGQMVTWTALNQATQTTETVNLPAFKVGGKWLGQNDDTSKPTPIIDEVVDVVGGAASIFQRINDEGDMLRVASTVRTEDGKRAIGTFVPAILADGTPNPVISTIMNSETFSGVASVLGEPYIANYEPIKDASGKVVGMLAVAVPQIDPLLREWILELVVGTTGYVFVIQGSGEGQGNYIISKGGSRDGENIWEAKDDKGNLFIQDMITQSLAAAPGEISHIEYDWKNEGEDVARTKVSAATYFPDTNWVIGAGTYYSDFESTVIAVTQKMNFLVVITLIIALVLVVLGALVALWIANMIANPLISLVGAAQSAADGDLTVEIKESKLKDEVGQLTGAFKLMIANTHEAVSAVAKAATDLAATSEELSAGADETGRAVNEVAHSTGQLAVGAQTVTENVNHAQENLRQNAVAVESIAKDIEDVAGYATEASNQGAEGRKSADEGSEVIQRAARSVQETTKTVQALGDKTNQIAEFIGIITGIADQTNLLALNAAIEAARAGEAGRGFAVVAEEVRKLAEESNSAAGNITELVKSITDEMQVALSAMNKSDKEVSEGAEIVQRAGTVLSQIVQGVDALTEKVQAISAAAEEINANTSEIVGTMDSVVAVAEGNAASSEQISSATQEQNASMEEIASSANSLASLAQDLSALVSRFKV